MTVKIWNKSFWIKETFSGGTEYRKRVKVLLSILPFVLAALLYKLLIMIESLDNGAGIIMALAYAVIVLMVTLMLLVIIVSIIEYLRRFE